MPVQTDDLVDVQDQIRRTEENVTAIRQEVAALRTQATWIARLEALLIALATAILGLQSVNHGDRVLPVVVQGVLPSTSTSTVPQK